METPVGPPPSPFLVFEAINAYHRTAAIKAAIELQVFTAIDNGRRSAAEIAAACGAAERGVRIICDNLVVYGLLTKDGTQYGLTATAKTFLSGNSPAYMGGAIQFLLSPTIMLGFDRMTEAVRRGGTAIPESGTLAPEHNVWVDFARAMAPMMMMPAQQLAETVLKVKPGPIAVLDIAAGHGLYGLAVCKANPASRLTALDWANVLEVATENAAKIGLADRFTTIAGSAFDAPLGGPYDVILLPNFLHHFDPPTCVALAKRLKSALNPDGVVATMEFVPNDDRVSPPGAATFSLVMLASTPSGDAYTFKEYEQMFADAGYSSSELHRFEGAPHAVVLTRP
ncbi:methyltransferase [Humisphaera borealis]|uniref:Class I SAM-dependent methyltransferase n=1 Tax=Humisphaera borealis TaxID=2807512 RepID=A0A7M2WQE3_9BACT|nr:class I SAM-dependent methyltransferase [Humisphaera borealis]QOV87747.1 class I SAM-dependent methyltransferase [Humisphaera borealis]